MFYPSGSHVPHVTSILLEVHDGILSSMSQIPKYLYGFNFFLLHGIKLCLGRAPELNDLIFHINE